MNRAPSYRAAAIITLLFAACPTVELGLMTIAELIRFRGGATDHSPVGFGVPPIWMIMAFSLILSLPWIAAGVLLLRCSAIGRWLALILTLPATGIAVMFGCGAIYGFCWVWIVEHNREGLIASIVFGPVALLGLLFCLTIWRFQFLSWRKIDSRQDFSPESSRAKT